MSSLVAEEENKQKQKTEPVKPVTAQPEVVQRDLADVNGPEGGMLPGNVSARIQSMRGGGQRLSDRSLQHYSEKFGRDMSDVHVHTDTASDTISRSLNARAFTIGSDVFLTKGINPDGGGRDAQTMTHELTHVVQQGGHASAGPLKLGAADTAQEHEAESTAQREFDPSLKEDDGTIQRGFWSDLGSAIAGKALDTLGIGEAMSDFMSGDKKVKAAIEKMSDKQRIEYTGVEENIKRAENKQIPDLEKELSFFQSSLQKVIGDPTKANQQQMIMGDIQGTAMALQSVKNMLQADLKSQLEKLQDVDATITRDDVNRYRSGKTKTFFSSIFSSIGGNILGSFESDPEKKAAAKAKGRSSINSWFASKNKDVINSPEETEAEKATKAAQIEDRQKALVDSIWNEVSQDPQLSGKYTKLLFKREIAKNHMAMIQESIKEKESDDDIKASVLMLLRNSAQMDNQGAGAQPNQPASA